MSIRLLCVVCQKGSEQFSLINFMNAAGEALTKQNLCDECRVGRTLKCEEHNEQHVVLIDCSSVCPSCVRKQWVAIHDARPEYWKAAFQTFTKIVPKTDRKDFLHVMRCALDDKKALVGQCLVTAIVVFSQRHRVTFEVALRYAHKHVARTKSLFTILPSSDPKKRFRP